MNYKTMAVSKTSHRNDASKALATRALFMEAFSDSVASGPFKTVWVNPGELVKKADGARKPNQAVPVFAKRKEGGSETIAEQKPDKEKKGTDKTKPNENKDDGEKFGMEGVRRSFDSAHASTAFRISRQYAW